MPCPEPPQARPALALGVVALAALLLLPGLDATDLWAPDEPRYGAIAEGVRAGEPRDWILLQLNGEAYTQKPPLYYWLAALAGGPGGRVDEVAARLPSALAGVASVAVTVRLGTALLGGTAGALSGAILLTSFEFAHRARRAQLDVLLTLFELIALAAFFRIQRGAGRRAADLAIFHGALGLAVLTKGPVGIVVPGLAIAAFLAWERRLRDLRPLVPLWGLALSLGPGLVWISAAGALAPAGYLGEAIGENLFGRFFAGTSHARPFYYYLYQLPADFLPWTLAVPLVVRHARRRVFRPETRGTRRRAWRFLLAWSGAAFVFFSLSAGKRGLYLLPIFPALALLTADTLLPALRATPPRAVRIALGGLAATAGVVGVAAIPVARSFGLTIAGWAPALLVAAVLAAVAVWRAAPRLAAPGLARALALVLATTGVELAVFSGLFPALDPEKSARAIAVRATALAEPDEAVGLVGKPTLVGALAYYGERRVEVLEEEGRLERFLSHGGRVIVVAEKRLDRVTRLVPVEVHARSRRGSRALLVVTAVAPAHAGAHPRDGPYFESAVYTPSQSAPGGSAR